MTSIWTIKKIQGKYFFVFKLRLQIVITWSQFIFIVTEKFNKKTLPSSVLHRITSMEDTVENITASHIID